MNNVVSLQDRRLEQEPHTTGQAKCLHCKHTWVAVAPNDMIDYMECPECGTMRGVWNCNFGLRGDEKIYVCSCDEYVFSVSDWGIICLCCGKETTFEELAE